MPRNVRNFWIEVSVDGRSSRIETGPVSKDGGFSMAILQRDKGGIVRTLNVRGYVDKDGRIELQAYIPREAEQYRHKLDTDPGDIIVRTVR